MIFKTWAEICTLDNHKNASCLGLANRITSKQPLPNIKNIYQVFLEAILFVSWLVSWREMNEIDIYCVLSRLDNFVLISLSLFLVCLVQWWFINWMSILIWWSFKTFLIKYQYLDEANVLNIQSVNFTGIFMKVWNNEYLHIYSLVNLNIYSTYCSIVCSVCSFQNLYWCSPKLFLITEVPEWAEVPQKKRWMLCLFYRYIIVFTAHWRLHFVHCT